MPYIKKEYRDILNKDINNLLAVVKHIEPDDLEGCLNYVITLLVDDVYGAGGYAEYNKAIGVLECVKQEFYARLVRPYEDKKIAENNDVYNKSHIQGEKCLS